VHLEDELKKQAMTHSVLQGRLQETRNQQTLTERELRSTRLALAECDHPLPATAPVRKAHDTVTTHAGDTSGAMMSMSLSVAGSDELADPLNRAAATWSGNKAPRGGDTRHDHQEAPLQQLVRWHREATDVGGSAMSLVPPSSTNMDSAVKGNLSMRMLKRSSLDVWSETPRWRGPESPLLKRMPLMKSADVARSVTQLRQLLSGSQGILYEDDKVTLEFTHVHQTAGRPRLAFTALLTNHSGHDLQQLHITAQEAPFHAYKLRIEPEPGVAPFGFLRSQAKLRFRGELEVLGVFEKFPKVDFSYLLPDNLHCHAILSLPLAISQLMVSVKPSPKQFLEQWNLSESAHAEVAFICPLRCAQHGVSPPFECAKSLEFGGAFQQILGASESVEVITLASSYPQKNGGPVETLVCVELGGHSRTESLLCRVAVRSMSHALNRALAQVFLYALSEPACELAGTEINF